MTDHDTAPGPMSGAPDAIDVPTRLEEIELRLSYYSKSATPGWYRDDVRYLLNLAKAAIAERDAARARLVEVEAGVESLLNECENDIEGAPDPHYMLRRGGVDLPYMVTQLQALLDDAAPSGTTGGGA